MNTNLIGRFYFKRTSNGNLIGEFSNNKNPNKIFTESADLDLKDSSSSYKVDNAQFNGNYHTTWYDEKSTSAKLEIRYKENSDKIYSLTWIGENKEDNFWGEGMLCDDILIGDYRNFEYVT